MFRRIIVPLDGSHVAARPIPYAARFARAFDASRMRRSAVAQRASP